MDPTMIVMIIALIAVFYFLMIRPQQKKQKEQQSMQRSLGPGNTVMLASGVYGEIVDNSNDTTSVVRIADGVEITVLKQAIVKSVPASEFPGASVPEEIEDTDEPLGSPGEIDRQAGTRQDSEYGENLTGTDTSSSGYDAPGSATRSRVTDGGVDGDDATGKPSTGGSSPLNSTGSTGATGTGPADAVENPTDDENPNNPKA